MQKKIAIPLVLFISFILLACSISMEGINFTDDEELDRLATGTALSELVSQLSEEAPSSGVDAPPPLAEPTSVPQPHPGQLVPTARIADVDYRHSVVDAKENPLSSRKAPALRAARGRRG